MRILEELNEFFWTRSAVRKKYNMRRFFIAFVLLGLSACYNYSHTPVSTPPGFPPPQQTPIGAQACGGMAGAVCAGPNTYCHLRPQAQCGAADMTGVCRVKPQICVEIYAPVCGCDGRTYANECKANAEGVSAVYSGECRR